MCLILLVCHNSNKDNDFKQATDYKQYYFKHIEDYKPHFINILINRYIMHYILHVFQDDSRQYTTVFLADIRSYFWQTLDVISSRH